MLTLQPTNNVDLQTQSLLKRGVEFVGLINKQGRIDNSLLNDMNLPSEKKEMLFMEASLLASMQSYFDEDFGPVRYNITERGGSKFVSLPTSFGTIFVMMQRKTNHYSVIKKITRMINGFSKSNTLLDHVVT